MIRLHRDSTNGQASPRHPEIEVVHDLRIHKQPPDPDRHRLLEHCWNAVASQSWLIFATTVSLIGGYANSEGSCLNRFVDGLPPRYYSPRYSLSDLLTSLRICSESFWNLHITRHIFKTQPMFSEVFNYYLFLGGIDLDLSGEVSELRSRTSLLL